MNVCIAFVRTKNGTEAVLRGTPKAVSRSIDLATDKGGGGEILCQVQREVSSHLEENDLWLLFIDEAAKVDLVIVAKEKWEIWRRKATFLWNPDLWDFDLSDDAVCIFMRDQGDMILQAPKPGTHKSPKRIVN